MELVNVKMKNTAENNKFISEFMDVDKHGDTEFLINRLICNYKTMQYHESWDWLMPVVEKIESMNFTSETTSLHGTAYTLTFFSDGKIIVVWAHKRKIIAHYKAVVGFIKWYNKQNQ